MSLANKEIEFKFAISEYQDYYFDDLYQALQQLGMKLGDIKVEHLHNIYFDNASKSLTANKVGLRLRISDEGIEQTIKCKIASQGSLHERFELNVAYKDVADKSNLQPDLSLFDLSDFPTNIDLESLQGPYEQIAYIPFERKSFTLEFMDSVYCLSIDQSIESKAYSKLESYDISEMEIELVSTTLQGDLKHLITKEVYLLCKKIFQDDYQTDFVIYPYPFSKLNTYMLRQGKKQKITKINAQAPLKDIFRSSAKALEEAIGYAALNQDLKSYEIAHDYLLNFIEDSIEFANKHEFDKREDEELKQYFDTINLQCNYFLSNLHEIISELRRASNNRKADLEDALVEAFDEFTFQLDINSMYTVSLLTSLVISMVEGYDDNARN